ncbi:MAG: LuxR C-terminal-related transcriptional regulator, partial [Maribacter sp.]
LKAYTKDSLKILLVKLIGIQQLAKKGLLDRDIAKNQDYYLKLLAELKESDMQPAEYQFLSRRLAYLTQDVVTEKYKRSKAINILLIIIVAGLSVFVYRFKKRQSYIPIGLSKQEKNVQSLILEGKSNKEIANELFISLSTVKTHITNIYGKLKVANRSELIRKTNNS